MFCTNCGREIIDTARFCNFCGMPVRNMAASIPVQPVQPVQQVQPVPQPVPESDHTESPDIPVTDNASVGAADIESVTISESENSVETAAENVSEIYEASEMSNIPAAPEASETPIESSAAISAPVTENVPPLPTPNAIPTYGASEPSYPAQPVYPAQNESAVPVQSVPVQSIPEKRPERKYTLGHIMMCLAAVAVMAIVAGVFAGLYFSVV